MNQKLILVALGGLAALWFLTRNTMVNAAETTVSDNLGTPSLTQFLSGTTPDIANSVISMMSINPVTPYCSKYDSAYAENGAYSRWWEAGNYGHNMIPNMTFTQWKLAGCPEV